MGGSKRYSGYQAYQYLEPGVDDEPFKPRSWFKEECAYTVPLLKTAGFGLRTEKHPEGDLEGYMEHIEYCIDLTGIDHVGCGPDTLYGDHAGLYRVGAE